MSYYYNHHQIYLLLQLLSVFLITIKAEDLLDQYVRHVQLVNNFETNGSSDSNILHQVDLTLRNSSNNKFNEDVKRLARLKRDISSDIDWTHSMTLDNDGLVVLRWQPRHQEILFRVEAKTLGYVGIGFSQTGGMAGADIVIAWVDDHSKKSALMVSTKSYVQIVNRQRCHLFLLVGILK